jgi:hypothetical protein
VSSPSNGWRDPITGLTSDNHHTPLRLAGLDVRSWQRVRIPSCWVLERRVHDRYKSASNGCQIRESERTWKPRTARHILPKEKTSPAEVLCGSSEKASGGTQRLLPAELVAVGGCDRVRSPTIVNPKSVRHACPSSEIRTLPCIHPRQQS